MNMRLFCPGLLVGMLSLIATDTEALMLPMATTTMVDRAEFIVEGVVTDVTCRWSDDRKLIITECILQPMDILLGSTNEIVIQYEGGVVGEYEMRVSDMPILTNGQHVLVFLRSQEKHEQQRTATTADTRPRYNIVAAAQGVYRIAEGRGSRTGYSLVGSSPGAEHTEQDVAELKRAVLQRLHKTGRTQASP